MASDRTFEKYARLLKAGPGWAVWTNVRSGNLRPGTVGYFDSDGIWTERETSPFLDNIERLSVSMQPLESTRSSYSTVKAGAGAGGPAVGVPVRAMLNFGRHNAQSHIAFCSMEEATEVRLRDSDRMRTWIQEQAGQLIQNNHEVINRYGLWAVTGTYTSVNVAKLVKASHQEGSLEGLILNSGGLGDIDLRAARWRGALDGVGVIHRGIAEDENNQTVFFFRGLRFVGARPLTRKPLSRIKSPTASDLSRGGGILRKTLKPTRIQNSKGLEPYGGTYSVEMQVDAMQYQLDYELWDNIADPFVGTTAGMSAASDVVSQSSFDPWDAAGIPVCGGQTATYTSNVPKTAPTVSADPWIWNQEYSRYYRYEYDEAGIVKYIWA